MTDIVITPANVVAGANAKTVNGAAGATILAGQAVYLDAVTGKYLLADNDAVTVAARAAVGIALNGASLNQPLQVAIFGDVTIGATLVAGVAYYLSAAPGGICPVADLVAGKTVCLLGFANTTAILRLEPIATGVTL